MNAGAATEKGNTSSGKWIHLPLVAPLIRVFAGAAACCRAWVLRNGAYTAGLIMALSLIYGPVLATHVKHSMNPFVFNSNVRILIFPFFKYHDSGVFPNDYFSPYIRAALPVGYRALYTLGAVLWDPATISKVLPYVLLTLTVGATAVVARRLSGYFGAFLGAALILSSAVFFDRMAGGLPRAFAFPTLALAAAALVYGKPRLLASVVCVGAAFYPPAAMVGGIALAIWLLLLAKADHGEAADWCFLRRARLITLTGVFSVLILLPTLIAGHTYGRLLSPRDVVEYPEIGPDGRYGVEDRPPFGTFPKAALEQARLLFRPVGAPLSKTVQQWAKVRNKWTGNSNGDVILELIIGALLIGGIFVAAGDSTGRRLLLLGAAAWLGHLIARPLAPYFYFPQRYIEYPVPILLVLLIPAVGAAIGSQISHCRFVAVAREVGVIAMAVVALLPFAGRGNPDRSLQINVTPQQRGLYTFLEQLPKDVLIAGWPDDLDNVPYVSRRQAFLTSELHMPFYKRYADEMRRRMRAIIAAYFASDRIPLERLRDQFGVTHLIFQQKALEKPPEYFEPFSGWIQKAFNDGRRKGFEIPRQLEASTVFSDGTLIVLDLRRLGAL
ncbi:MAG: hypothetical protein DME97_00210 [Verrucomicrobia bacterium]|nr:MAG: hypothetical protein DME97_00210 [Verrucomicrobiota bacterium]